jgi:hypothetical protein
MRRAACARQDGPAIIVPVDYEVGVAQEADDKGDGECWDGRRVLDKKPSGGLGFVTKYVEECPDLP